jgi:hypothetical protein
MTTTDLRVKADKPQRTDRFRRFTVEFDSEAEPDNDLIQYIIWRKTQGHSVSDTFREAIRRMEEAERVAG